MQNRSGAYVVCLLFLAGGCHAPEKDRNPRNLQPIADTGPTEEQKRAYAEERRKHPERIMTVGQAALVSRVRERLPRLKPGMTQAQVMEVLKGLSLGEAEVVSRTISGGETVQYQLSPRHQLELTFIPRGLSEPPSGRLTEARLIE